jgi:hypothetical protein
VWWVGSCSGAEKYITIFLSHYWFLLLLLFSGFWEHPSYALLSVWFFCVQLVGKSLVHSLMENSCWFFFCLTYYIPPANKNYETSTTRTALFSCVRICVLFLLPTNNVKQQLQQNMHLCCTAVWEFTGTLFSSGVYWLDSCQQPNNKWWNNNKK